ncbi:MAG: aspartate kinase [Flavobacteriales bacterium]|nr:aspartate kinase [Flavobacteriales bacterium]
MKVFKFGGASVKDAAGVRNVANVLSHFPDDDLLIVVSAMGKTTNALEEVVWGYREGKDVAERVEALRRAHAVVLAEVAPTDEAAQAELVLHFQRLRDLLLGKPSGNVDRDYDQIVSQGEIWSTLIVSAHLKHAGLANTWVDARTIVRTDDTYRSARVDWETSERRASTLLAEVPGVPKRIVAQGFIGFSTEGDTTTLGREGSDFSAAIFAYLLDAESVTIWKDVPGMFNADPKLFPDTKLLSHISYREAIELSYFGASVIHPRTLQPLQKKHIPLYVRSFMDLAAPGSTIDDRSENDSLIPSFIVKPGQVLLSITPRDLSFVVEENLSGIFSVFSKHGVRVNMMQNSAVAFTVCADNDNRVKPLVMELRGDYEVKWNEGLELLTVRHPDEATLAKLTSGREILLEQRSRTTARFVLK